MKQRVVGWILSVHNWAMPSSGERLVFRGGKWGSAVPLALFLLFTLSLVIAGAPSFSKVGDNIKNNKNPHQNSDQCNCKFSSICVA